MTAEKLREAARLMRERAKAAGTNWPWYDPEDVAEALQPMADGYNNPGDDAEHIASWSPAVALAVADLLDTIAVGLEARGVTAHIKPSERAAFEAARTYLGEQS